MVDHTYICMFALENGIGITVKNIFIENEPFLFVYVYAAIGYLAA